MKAATIATILILSGCSNEYSPKVATDCGGKSQLIAEHIEHCTHRSTGACYMQAVDQFCIIVEVK